MKDSTKITFILHGKLKHIDKVQKRISSVFENDFDIDFRFTDPDNGARNEAKEAVEANVDFVIIAGGDGSLNETINGYMAAPEKLRNNVILGVLPMGSGNDFAKTIKVRNNLDELKAMIEHQSVINIDIGLLKFENLSGKTDQRYFINIADIGIGGNVAENLANGIKLFNPNITYTKAIISSFIRYKKQHVELTSKDYTWSGKMLSLCMANGKYFGSGMCIAPDACVNDGKIELTIMGNVSLWDYVKNLSKIKKGEKLIHDEVTYATIEECSIQAPSPCPIDMDGEFIGYTPIEMNILKSAVRIIGRL